MDGPGYRTRTAGSGAGWLGPRKALAKIICIFYMAELRRQQNAGGAEAAEVALSIKCKKCKGNLASASTTNPSSFFHSHRHNHTTPQERRQQQQRQIGNFL